VLKQSFDTTPFDMAHVDPIKTQKQFNNELEGLSEDAIVNYLKLTADTKDIDKINESIDQTKLPEETDYMDEEFLESFMKELEKTTTNTNTQIN
jgi:hypothetical protein